MIDACNGKYPERVQTQGSHHSGHARSYPKSPNAGKMQENIGENAKYIDRNYAGVLIIWDRLFGSFVEEDPAVPCEYGIIGQSTNDWIGSHNPIKLTFHEWIDMLRDSARAGGMRAALAQLFGPPERALSHPQRDPRLPAKP